jgi:hypothetical protein
MYKIHEGIYIASITTFVQAVLTFVQAYRLIWIFDDLVPLKLQQQKYTFTIFIGHNYKVHVLISSCSKIHFSRIIG